MVTSRNRKRVAILISGRGSNMSALIEATQLPNYPAEISLVLSNNSEAVGLKLAEQHRIKSITIDHGNFKTREEFDCKMNDKLAESNIDIVCLAGFMRLVSPNFVKKWQGKLLNIHPSLLPSFRGLNTHNRALDAGVKIHGCTVHMVSEELDAGPILIQGAVPVYANDDAQSLGDRVLTMEHKIYPQALKLLIDEMDSNSGASGIGENSKERMPSMIVPAPDLER